MADLVGKVIVVTGGGAGLGRAYARRLARIGARVAIGDVAIAAALDVADELQQEGCRAEAFAVDVTDAAQVSELMAAVVASLGPIAVLVNNAGGQVCPPGPMESFTVDQWQRTLSLNLTGTWLCTQAVVPSMKAAKHGKIINVSSSMVSKGYPSLLAPYVAAKAGVVGLTRALAKELGPFGITVNAIAPGLIPMDKGAGSDAKAKAVRGYIDLVVGDQALGRVGIPEDLCGAVEFLASAQSDFITGQVLNVDGGWAFN